MLRAASSYFAHSDTGRARRANEDAYFARSPVFVVADGMGGAQAGEVASRLAIEAFERGLDDAGANRVDRIASAEQLLADRVQEANARIHEMSQESQDRAGMGTTITAAHVGDHDVAVAHVGDSRAYRLRGDDFQRLTEDHSLVEEMRRRGQLTAQEADEHPQRSIITRALGPEPDVQVDTYSWRGESGDVFLLCSDGLTSMVPEGRVADIVRGARSLRDAGRALIDAANAAGGRDNITVVLFALEEVGGPDPALEQPTQVDIAAPNRAGGAAPSREPDRAGGAAPSREPDRVDGVVHDADRADRVLAQGQASRPRPSPEPRVEPRGGRAESQPAPPPPAPRRLQPTAPAAPPDERSRRRGRRGRRARRRGRRLGALFAILALIVVPLGLGAYIANQAVYFVGTDEDGFVTMYRGLPYDLPAGLDLYSPTYVSGVRVDTLPATRRKRLIDHTLRSHDDAADLVRELERGRVAS
ncbi:MAG TPA: Stp1/IreP family PP2C-type Ser/Thr phosphatase [Solirubrobacteraceae bacterium]|jgi:protein phosphatase|nr:Stp1/IreP family PP2C-type Ser/Thr phosphatase [Solirubrobacteraceae bacterium]